MYPQTKLVCCFNERLSKRRQRLFKNGGTSYNSWG